MMMRMKVKCLINTAPNLTLNKVYEVIDLEGSGTGSFRGLVLDDNGRPVAFLDNPAIGEWELVSITAFGGEQLFP